ncbi:hypothetical protein Q5O_10620 [Pseudomonas putida JB]|nr:hypothetical protein Q5O_10620 [Pseudomonas putida JB]
MLNSEPAGHRAALMYIKHSEQLDLHSRLWRLPRAISRWNQLQVGETELLEFKLMTCIAEVDHILDAFNRKNLRDRVLRFFRSSKLINDAGISSGLPPAEAVADLARLKELGMVMTSSSGADWIEPGLPSWVAEGIL